LTADAGAASCWIMRIDGRFDSESWIQPRANEASEPAKIADAHQQRREAPTAAAARESEPDFVLEVRKSHAFTRAARTAESVANLLAATRDL
jgi:hypothetical protein